MKLSNFMFFLQLAVHFWNNHKEAIYSSHEARLFKIPDYVQPQPKPQPISSIQPLRSTMACPPLQDLASPPKNLSGAINTFLCMYCSAPNIL
jgi:hypothetical protein